MPTTGEIIRASYAAFARGDLDAALAVLSPEVEWTHPDGMCDYGLGGTKKGHAEVLEFMARARTVFSEIRQVPEEFVEAGDRVMVLGVHHMRGAASGTSGAVPFVHSWRFENGLATHFSDYHDTAEVRRIVEGDRPLSAWLLETHDVHIRSCAVQLATKFRIPDLLGGGPREVDELAKATGTDPRALFRLLRTLAGFEILSQAGPHAFALTGIGEHLRRDNPQSVGAIMEMSGIFNRVFADAEYSLKTGEPAFAQAFGLPLFDYLRQNPEVGALFNAAMSEFSALETDALVEAYDFGQARRIVDVGGGDGTLLTTLLNAYPGTTGVVFDQPQVVEAAQARIPGEGLTERCSVMGGDFFTGVAPGGDLYVLKWIIHDWPDDQAVEILRNVRRAMAPGGRVLLIERVVPDSDVPHSSKVMDFTMLVVLGGQERTFAEYSALFTAAGLRLDRVLPGPAGSSLLEAIAEG